MTAEPTQQFSAAIAAAGLPAPDYINADGAVLYYAARWGMNRALHDLKAAAHFLVQIGGGA